MLALTARVWMAMIGRQASTTAVRLARSTSNPVTRPTTSIASTIAGRARSHSPGMPELTLSAVTTVTSTADGSRLKCIIGTQLPAKTESIRKFRASAA